MPDGLAVVGSVNGGQWLGEQPGQRTEVPGPAGAIRRFQPGRMGEPGDQVGIGMLVPFPGPYK